MIALLGAAVPLLLWSAPSLGEDRVSAQRERGLFRVVYPDGHAPVTVSMPWGERHLVFHSGKRELGRLDMASELPGGVAVIGSDVLVSSFSAAEKRGQLILVSVEGGQLEELERIRLPGVDPWQVCRTGEALYIWDFASDRVVRAPLPANRADWNGVISAAMQSGAMAYRFDDWAPFGDQGNYDERDYEMWSATSGDGFFLVARASVLHGLATFQVWPKLGGFRTEPRQSTPHTPAALARQAAVAELRQRPEDAKRLRKKAVECAENQHGRLSATYAWHLGRLGEFLKRNGESEEAHAKLTQAVELLTAMGLTPDAEPFERAAMRLLAKVEPGGAVKPSPHGCVGDSRDPFTTTSRVSITPMAFSISNGACGEAEPVLCTLSGSYTIHKHDGFPIFVRHLRNGKVIRGTEMVESVGDHTVDYEGESVACGDQLEVRVYLFEPRSVDQPADAGWSFTCTSCQITPAETP